MILKRYREVISEQRSSLDANAVLSFFHSCLHNGRTINRALSAILSDPVVDSFTEQESDYLVYGILIPEMVLEFAGRFSALTEEETADINTGFERWAESEGLSQELSNLIATVINDATEAAAEDEDNDARDSVFSVEDWKKLTDEQRAEKVKIFLRCLAGAHNDARLGKPFIKKLDAGRDIYNNDYRGGVKTFDREANRFGSNTNNDEDDNREPLRTSNIAVERTALPNRPIVEQLAVVDRGNSVQRYARYMNRTLKNTSAGGYSRPAKAVQEAGRLRDEENKKFDYGKKDDREKDYTPLNETEFLDKKRKNN
jgi:hypothetical protein